MARPVRRLTAIAVKNAKRPGLYSDGAGLYLQVSPGGSKSWIFRYGLRGKEHHHGLGPLITISLAEARDAALHCRQLLLKGVDPIATRKAEKAAGALKQVQGITFRECAERFISGHEASWRSPIHRRQWQSSLRDYVYPVIGALPVSAIDTALVLKVIEPIWTTKPETAGRVRGRIESVLDWAKAHRYRDGENPARWRGHLDKLLPKKSKIRRIRHFPALPYAEIAAFMARLRKQESMAARALEFTILTAARSGEVLGMTHAEIKGDVWTIPAERMKALKEHRVPLSPAALGALEQLRQVSRLDAMAMQRLLRRMGYDVTVHGFRSTFRDWAAEQTNFPREICEAALAHSNGDKVEAAYRRSDLFDKRRELMTAWADYATKRG
jgi:integrase